MDNTPPNYQSWPDTRKVARLFGLSEEAVQKWYQRLEVRERMGTVKDKKKLRFSPEWFEEFDKCEEYVSAEEAAKILGERVSTMRSITWKRALKAAQPFGHKGRIFYDKRTIKRTKKELKNLKGLLPPSEAARELELFQIDTNGTLIPNVAVLKTLVPVQIRHPITGERLYLPETLEKYRKRPAVRYSSLREVLTYCEKNHPVQGLRKK